MRIVLLLAALACALPAAAIVRRADRDDGEYIELASRYHSALALGGFGEGVLIAPRWILTSAGVAAALRAAHSSRIAAGGAAHEIESILSAPESLHADLALILLRDAVAGIEPTPPHREPDERGKAVVIVGHGASAVFGGEAAIRDERVRGGINTVDRADATALVLDVKKADDASDLQGAAGPGDEGAPAYLEVQGRLSVAGIAHGPRAGAIAKPGDEDVYTRVSAFVPWIDEAMFRAAADEAAAQTARKPARRRD
jgi:hypothetical protein